MTLQLENYLVHDELTIADILKPDLPPGRPIMQAAELAVSRFKAGWGECYQIGPACFEAGQLFIKPSRRL